MYTALICLRRVLCKQFYFIILENTRSELLGISKYLAGGVVPNLGEDSVGQQFSVVATDLHSVFVEKQVHLLLQA